MTVLELEQARAFEGEDVVCCYSARPPYPRELYRFLLQLPPSRVRALDLGCGPGKIALALADSFEQVDAIDPSAAMIEAGIRTDNGAHPNVEWLVANAEDAVLSGPYDLVTAGASIHWMRHDIVFPKLAAVMPVDGVLAMISGDDASGAPWLEQWTEFRFRWLERIGRKPDDAGLRNALHSYEPWMDIAGTRLFKEEVIQSIEDFVTCQHSRATWARSAMGHAASAFDVELKALLEPYSDNGLLAYETTAELVWGKPRRIPHASNS